MGGRSRAGHIASDHPRGHACIAYPRRLRVGTATFAQLNVCACAYSQDTTPECQLGPPDGATTHMPLRLHHGRQTNAPLSRQVQRMGCRQPARFNVVGITLPIPPLILASPLDCCAATLPDHCHQADNGAVPGRRARSYRTISNSQVQCQCGSPEKKAFFFFINATGQPSSAAQPSCWADSCGETTMLQVQPAHVVYEYSAYIAAPAHTKLHACAHAQTLHGALCPRPCPRSHACPTHRGTRSPPSARPRTGHAYIITARKRRGRVQPSCGGAAAGSPLQRRA